MNPTLVYNGKHATQCDAVKSHSPAPVRFVWHHIQPKEAGGQTAPGNMISVCDNCHYTIHRIMWVMRLIALQLPVTEDQRSLTTKPPRRSQLVIAGKGYEACRLAGTIDHIPNEG